MLPQSFTPRLLAQLELLKIHTRRAYLGTRQGGHVSVKRGHGIEFADYRRYELGDNPRHIDWGVFGRSDRLFVKTFQEDQDLSVVIIIDPTNSMLVPAGSGKWQRACEIALAIAYIALMEQDSVCISVPGSLHTPLMYGSRAIHQLGRSLMELKPVPATDLEREFRHALSRVRFPGVCIFISDLLMPIGAIENISLQMRAKNLDSSVIQTLSPEDTDPFPRGGAVVAVDSESGAEIELAMSTEDSGRYQSLLEAHNLAVKQLFLRGGIRHCIAPTAGDLASLLTATLPRTGLLR